MLLRCTPVVALVAACQGNAGSEPHRAGPVEITVRDAKGTVVTRVKPTTPCRATVDGIEQIVGTAPIVSQIGTTRWSGDSATNGTTFKKDDTTIARLYAASDAELALFDPDGIAFVRAMRDASGDVSIVDRQSAVVRHAHARADAAIEISGDGPKLVVTGTDDVLLAAILTAPEAIPEVRGLAACNRLFPSTKAF